jgi:hypothetical protein
MFVLRRIGVGPGRTFNFKDLPLSKKLNPIPPETLNAGLTSSR